MSNHATDIVVAKYIIEMKKMIMPSARFVKTTITAMMISSIVVAARIFAKLLIVHSNIFVGLVGVGSSGSKPKREVWS